MRALVLIATLALAACTQTAGGGECSLTATRTLSFSADGAEDTIVVRALGPSCENAVGVFAVHGGDGHPQWAWSAPLSRAFGQFSETGSAEETQAFLQRWADEAQIATTQTAPTWGELQSGQSTLDQLTYEDIRARDLPMLCHYSGTGRQACVFFEPAAGGAGHFYDRDVAEETSQ